MLWIRGHFQQSSSGPWYLSCWCPESESWGEGGRVLRCSQTGSKHKVLLARLCLVNNLPPVKGKAWGQPIPSH